MVIHDLVQWLMSKLTAWKSTKVHYKNTDSQASPSKYIYLYFQSFLMIPMRSHVGKHWPKEYHPTSFMSRTKSIIFWLLSTSLTILSATPSPYASFRPPSLSLCCALYQEATSPTQWSNESIPPFPEISLTLPLTSIVRVFSLSSYCPLYPPPAT